MDLKLRILQGTNAGQEVTIRGPKFLIGRDEDCHLRPGSETISRHHCVIVVDQSYVAVRDFGSKNGTYVNRERVVGERELKSGDQLHVGPLQFEILLRQGELGGKKKPPVHDLKEAAERTAAGQPEEQDISQWLTDPTSETPGIAHSRSVAAIDTQSIRLTETAQIELARMRSAVAPSPAQPAEQIQHQAVALAVTPAVLEPAAMAKPVTASPITASPVIAAPVTAPAAMALKRALPSTFQMPEPEPIAPVAEDASGRLGKTKVFGKLPRQSKRPENTRSAAADLLDKMRKRR